MRYLFLLVVFIFISCGKYDLQNRIILAKSISKKANFKSKIIKTKDFEIQTYIKKSNSNILKIYLEGDGFSWLDKNTISSNPTPINPVALRLASIDKSNSNIAYIARPCQYITYNCNNQYWSDKRYSLKIINNINQAISIIKNNSNSKKIELIGFSGGGAIAILIASIRDDISKITTISGNLNHKLLNKYHNVSPMNNSLNPIDVALKVSHIPQIHYIGLEDKIIPLIIVQSFKKASKNKKIKIIKVKNVTHTKGWIEYFSRIN